MQNTNNMSHNLNSEDLRSVNFVNAEVPDLEKIFSAVTHELRTPVAVIKSNVELLSQKEFQLDETMKEECLSMCADSTDILVRFLDQIQFILMASRNGINPKLSSFHIQEIYLHQIPELKKLNLDPDRISVHQESGDKEIVSDKNFSSQILLHLLTNGLKFSRGEINLYITANQGKLKLKVQDFGSGIPEPEKSLVFNPFYRSENVKRISGMGLGLSIVKIMTESLGGEIMLASTIDSGTIIQVTIPY